MGFVMRYLAAILATFLERSLSNLLQRAQEKLHVATTLIIRLYDDRIIHPPYRMLFPIYKKSGSSEGVRLALHP